MNKCLDENLVVEFVQGTLSEEKRATAVAHLDQCDFCRQLVSAAARLSSARAPKPDDEDTTIPDSNPPVCQDDSPLALTPGYLLAGRYQMGALLGCGSFGAVYEALDTKLGERVAIKLLNSELRSQAPILEHFRREIVVGRRITHPNICRLHDLGSDGELQFITMQLVEGETLDVRLAQEKFTEGQVQDILRQISAALTAAHAQQVVHRDLKPGNIMLGSDGHVTVMDFGLARDLRGEQSMSGLLVGSPAYWSPEQAQGNRATQRSDIYAFGLIAAELFGAKRPTFGQILSLGNVPSYFRPIIERCLQTDPEARFVSGEQLHARLIEALRKARPIPKKVYLIASMILALVLLGLGSLLFLRAEKKAPPVIKLNPPLSEPKEIVESKQPTTNKIVEDETVEPESKIKKSTRKHPRKFKPIVAKTPALSSTDIKKTQELENLRRARGFLLDDIPIYRQALESCQRAIKTKSQAGIIAANQEMELQLSKTRLDGPFINGKLARLTKKSNSTTLAEAQQKNISEIFSKVHEYYFAGKYQRANDELNRIAQQIGAND